MAFTPVEIFPDYQLLTIGATVPVEGIYIPLSNLSLTAQELNAIDGDGRKLMFALIKACHNKLAMANPDIGMVSSYSGLKAISDEVGQKTYALIFDVDISQVGLITLG